MNLKPLFIHSIPGFPRKGCYCMTANTSLDSPVPEKKKHQLIGQYLLTNGYISKAALHAALEEQKITQERLGMILVRGGFITRLTLIEAILATNPDMIHGESHFTTRVPHEILLRTQTQIVAET